MSPRINTFAWVSWLVAILMVISRTRNPLYLVIIFLVVFTITTYLSRLTGRFKPLFFLRMAAFFIVISAVFNALFAHYGQTVLFTIPAGIPIAGGPITLEAILYGAINGFVLACIFGAFVAISLALSTRAIVRLVPRAFYPVAVILSIALTYLPNTLRQFQQIREAQAVRGHRMRSLRDWLPLVIPLVVGGLERAFNLAESMTARGFASQRSGLPIARRQFFTLFGLLSVLAGWLLRLGGISEIGGSLLMIVGMIIMAAILWAAGRNTPLTSYRQESWSRMDSLIVVGAVISLCAVLLPLPGLNQDSLAYNPYPVATLPSFDPLIGIALLGLLCPLVGMQQSVPATQTSLPPYSPSDLQPPISED